MLDFLFKRRKAATEPAQPDIPQHGWQYMAVIGEVKRQAEERGDTGTVQTVLDMTYDGQLPMRKPDGSYTSIYNPVLDFNLAGVNFRKKIRDYVGDFEGYLQPEPDNEYDPDAIAVFHRDGHHLGYIPQNCTDDIRDLDLLFPLSVWGNIEEDYDYDERRKFYRGIVFVEVPNPTAISPIPKNTKK